MPVSTILTHPLRYLSLGNNRKWGLGAVLDTARSAAFEHVVCVVTQQLKEDCLLLQFHRYTYVHEKNFLKRSKLPLGQPIRFCASIKAHSLCKQCLHDLHFLKKGSFSPNLSKLARADISCHFMKTRSLCRTVDSMNGF